MKKLMGALAVAASLLLAACSSSAGGGPSSAPPAVTSSDIAPATDSPITDTPITDDTTPVPDTPELLTPGATANIFTTDGSFDLTVGKPLAIATQSGLTNRWLGIPVKIANVDGKPNVSEGNFGLGPVKYGDTGKITSGVTIDLGPEQKTACKGTKPLSEVSPDGSDSGLGYDIGP